MSQHDQAIIERGVLTLSDKDWAEAKRRSSVILPLAGSSRIGRQKADQASRELGLLRRQVYELVRRDREGTGCLTDMAPTRSKGGKDDDWIVNGGSGSYKVYGDLGNNDTCATDLSDTIVESCENINPRDIRPTPIPPTGCVDRK